MTTILKLNTCKGNILTYRAQRNWVEIDTTKYILAIAKIVYKTFPNINFDNEHNIELDGVLRRNCIGLQMSMCWPAGSRRSTASSSFTTGSSSLGSGS